MEGFLGTELNLYDIGDLNLLTSIVVYPTIISDESVESGRVRTDFRFDAKYDDIFIEDFYVRAGFTLNYDNRPAEAGSEVDYTCRGKQPFWQAPFSPLVLDGNGKLTENHPCLCSASSD